MTIRKNNISLSNLMIFCVIYNFSITWCYGNSYLLYTLLSVVIILPAYFLYMNYVIRKGRCTEIEFLSILLLVFSVMTGVLHGSIVSCVQVNTSLIVPFIIAYFNIDYLKLEKKGYIAILISVIFSMVLALTIDMNSNSMAFLIYIATSVSIICFFDEDNQIKKVVPLISIVILVCLLLGTGSRNAGIVMIICLILILLPNKVYNNKKVTRIIFVSVMLSTIFAGTIMEFVFGNADITEWLNEFTKRFSEKAYGMDSHLSVIYFIQNYVSELDIFTKLFGAGVKSYHCHNLFYQCVIFYGYLGTAIIYIIYAYIFEKGFSLYRDKKNKIALACCIILIGHFLMQIGEVYMLGTEQATLGALFPAGIILNIDRKLKWQN